MRPVKAARRRHGARRDLRRGEGCSPQGAGKRLKEVVADLTLGLDCLKKHDRGWGRRGMRCSASGEIRDHPAGRAIAWGRLDARWRNSAFPDRLLYRWYDRYQGGGPEALADRPSRPDRVWNRIPERIRSQIVDLALDQPELSPRELAVRFTDEEKYFVSEASVYRKLLKAHDLISLDASFGQWCEANGCGFDLFSERRKADRAHG